jgi:hypothetical protein
MAGPHHGASELLSHFIPRNILLQARELALKYQREEIARAYAEKRIGLVLAAGLGCMLLSAALAGGAAAFLYRIPDAPRAAWLGAAMLTFAIVIWLGLTVSLLYLFFDWLEKKALSEAGAVHAPAAGKQSRT